MEHLHDHTDGRMEDCGLVSRSIVQGLWMLVDDSLRKSDRPDLNSEHCEENPPVIVGEKREKVNSFAFENLQLCTRS